MAIVISIHQVADKSVTWKQAAQATQFGAIWLQLIGQEVWQKLSYLFDQLPRLHKSLGNPTDLVCSRNDYILWYKFQKFKKCKNISGYALIKSWSFELTHWCFGSVSMRSRGLKLNWRFHVDSNLLTCSKMFHEANLLLCKHNLKYFPTAFLMFNQGFMK